MSDTPNIVKVVISKGIIEVIDNNKTSNNVTIVQTDTGVSVVNQQPTVVTTVPRDKAVVTTETTKTSVVQVAHPGPRGVKGDNGATGNTGDTGPRGYRGQDGSTFIITAVTSSQYINTIESGSLPTGSIYILTNSSDEGNNISGSIGDGIIWSGAVWFNSGPIQGPSGPQGVQGNQGDVGNDSTIEGPIGPQGPVGADGPVGPVGPAGPQGPVGGSGPAGTVTVHSTVALAHTLPPVVTEMGSDSSNASLKFSIPGGIPGQSAFEVWVGQGNVGNEAAFLVSLKGDQGDDGVITVDDIDASLFSGVLATDFTASLWSDYQTNFTVGYIAHGDTFASGSTIESVLRAMLSQSQPAIPASLYFDGFYKGSTEISYANNEVGIDVEIDNVVFTKAGEGVTIGGISSTGADTNFGTPTLIDVGDTSPAYFTPQTFTRSTIGGVTMGLTWSGGAVKNKTAAFKAYAYLGGYPEIVLTGDSAVDNAAIVTMVDSIRSQRSILTSTVTWQVYGTTETQTKDNFTYIVYPSILPVITDIIDSNGFTLQIPNPTWTLLAADVPIQNSVDTADFTYNVDVYISEQERQITTLDQLNIT